MPADVNPEDGLKVRAKASLTRLSFEDLHTFRTADLVPGWNAFLRSARAIHSQAPELRPGLAPPRPLLDICRLALGQSDQSAEAIRRFIAAGFEPYLVQPKPGADQTFFTAYYRPEVAASLTQSRDFLEPLLSRPDDLVSLHTGSSEDLPPGFSAGRCTPDGRLEPYPSRAEIDAGALGERARPLAFVRDAIEAFMIQVQGSARLTFADGTTRDLTYAGRNGHPYSSIGKALIADGEMDLADMSLERLKAWVRERGQEAGEEGRRLLHRNSSFVFFSLSEPTRGDVGPIGAAGLPLAPLSSIAIDRTLWPYGLPFWVEAEIPWRNARPQSFARMMIAQDTGSAIVGPARADLYFGSGEAAGRLAGGIRHGGRLVVLLPKGRP